MLKVAGVHVPLAHVDCDDDVAEKEPPEMKPTRVPPVFEKDIVNEQDGCVVNVVVPPTVPVVGDEEQPLTVYVSPVGAPDSRIEVAIGWETVTPPDDLTASAMTAQGSDLPRTQLTDKPD